MELTNFIRIALLVICIGTALTFFVLAFIKRNKLTRNLNVAGLSFLLAILFNISIIKLQNVIFPPTDKIGQLRFLAFGKAENNENGWLGLYQDSTWEFGKSYREISKNGNYYISGDTIFLKSNNFNIPDRSFRDSLMIVNEEIINSANSSINGLKIEINFINSK